MITKRKLNKKLDLLLHRQNLLATVIFKTSLSPSRQKKLEKRWYDLWVKLIGEEDEP